MVFKIRSCPYKIGQDYEATHILPDTRILCLGQSGAGKSIFLYEYLSKVKSKFYEFYLFCGSGLDECLYKKL